MEKTRKFSIQLPENEYMFLKQLAASQNTTMADLLRSAWYEKANSFSALEDLNQKITNLEELFANAVQKDDLVVVCSDNMKRQKKLYQLLLDIQKSIGGKS